MNGLPTDAQNETKGASALAARPAMAFMPTNVDEALRMAKLLAESALLPDALKNKPNDVLVILMMGAEFGIAPLVAIRELYVVKGRPAMSSLMKVGLVKNSPLCEYFKCVESTPEVATFETKRKDEPGVTRFSYTIKEAHAAGYTKGSPDSNWAKNPTLMLRRRCQGQLADDVYPDVTRGAIDSDDATGSDEVSAPKIVPFLDRVAITTGGKSEVAAVEEAQTTAEPPKESFDPVTGEVKEPPMSEHDAAIVAHLDAAWAAAKTKADMLATIKVADSIQDPTVKARLRERYNARLREVNGAR